jgi:hypothetical protein
MHSLSALDLLVAIGAGAEGDLRGDLQIPGEDTTDVDVEVM